MRFLIPITIALALCAGACKDDAPKPTGTGASATGSALPPAPSAAKTAAAAPAGSAEPAADGEVKPPADAAQGCIVAFTGKNTGEGSSAGPEFTVTNKSSREVTACNIKAYAYDKSGKLMSLGGVGANGISIKPGETYKPSYGMWFKKPVKPEYTIEAVSTGASFADGSNWDDSSIGPDDRPKGGVKK